MLSSSLMGGPEADLAHIAATSGMSPRPCDEHGAQLPFSLPGVYPALSVCSAELSTVPITKPAMCPPPRLPLKTWELGLIIKLCWPFVTVAGGTVLIPPWGGHRGR